MAFVKSLTPDYVPGPALPAIAAGPAAQRPRSLANWATAVAAAVLVALIACWVTGVEGDPRAGRHPWLVRRFEPPWTDWDALSWEQKVDIARVRQAVSWTFAALIAVSIFVPLVLSASHL